MGRWFQFAIVVAAAGASLAMKTCHWDAVRPEGMLVLSVLAGAVLFRLGRGLPQMSVDYLEVDEAEKLAQTYRIVSRRLAVVAGVTAAALAGLAVIGMVHRLIGSHLPPDTGAILAGAMSAIVAAAIALAICRAVELVLGDLSTVAVQSDIIVDGVRRRHARKKEEALDRAARDQPFKKPSNYGDLV